VTVDVARQAMEQAQLVVGEINPHMPFTFGDTFVPLSDFDFVVKCDQEPLLFPRWPVEEVHDQVAANLASVIQDGSCLAFSIGPLYEALSSHLARKRNLGIHSPHFTDALMDLVKSGAVSNRYKQTYKGKSLTSYAMGSGELMAWLDRNPMVEFQGLEVTFDPLHIGRNPNFVALLPARKVDLSGRIALPVGKGNVVAGPGEALDYLIGAQISPGGQTIFALPSRNREGSANILLSVENLPNQISIRESVDLVVTEYGIASLQGRTVRERAQALIDIAHPQDRAALVEQAKAKRILYEDQIFLPESAQLYPDEITHTHTFGDGLEVRFRAIKPSDEEEMRRLFYRFSDEAIYYRYFSPIRAMPHAKMQEYVNIDYQRVMSLVGLAGEAAGRHIIAEGRYVLSRYEPFADVAFVVDEDFQGRGIATYLVKLLVEVARKQGIKGFTADVLASNRAMMKVFEKSNLKVHARLEEGEYRLTIPLEDLPT
jgi:GNAT superfamily N-acetyltransferase